MYKIHLTSVWMHIWATGSTAWCLVYQKSTTVSELIKTSKVIKLFTLIWMYNLMYKSGLCIYKVNKIDKICVWARSYRSRDYDLPPVHLIFIPLLSLERIPWMYFITFECVIKKLYSKHKVMQFLNVGVIFPHLFYAQVHQTPV